MTESVPMAEVRGRFTELTRRAAYLRESIEVTQHGKPVAQIVPPDAVAVAIDDETLVRLDEARDRVADTGADRPTREQMAAEILTDALHPGAGHHDEPTE